MLVHKGINNESSRAYKKKKIEVRHSHRIESVILQ